MKKHSLAILMAMGGPKSGNSSGSGEPSESIASPDQSGDAMAPGGGTDTDSDSDETPSSGEDEDDKYMLPLPAGFKAPGGDGDGTPFTTTIQCTIVDGPNGKMLDISKIGDMPVDGSSETEQEPPEDASQQEEDQTDTSGNGSEGEDQPSPSVAPSYMKKKKDSMAAKKAFQS